MTEDERAADQKAAELEREKLERTLAHKGEIAEALKRLSTQPEWELLKKRFEKKREKDSERLTRTIFAGGVVDQRVLDYERGFWNGVGAILSNPENAERAFHTAFSRLAKFEEAENAESDL